MSRSLAGPLLLALALRLVPVVTADRVVADVERYQRVGRHLLDVSWNPYETRRLYPYPPLWAPVEAAAEWASRQGFGSFAIDVKLPVLLADLLIVVVLVVAGRAGRAPPVAAWIYAAHPVSILITGFHGQFDAIALLLVLLATLIVLTSDHGEELGDHDPESFYDTHGHTNYEEMLHVPLVVKLPGSAHAGTRIDSVTSAIDVMPTVLDVAGVSAPEGQMQGQSLVGLWEGAGGEGRVAFAEAAAYEPEVKSVRSARYKLIFDIAPETVREHGRAFVPEVPRGRHLFDLANDPRELHDLLAEDGDEEAERIAAGLEKRLRAFASGTPGDLEEIELDAEALERLKAMGYVP